MRRRAVVLVDGEHYPPVVRDALGQLRREGIEPVAALFLGGVEKVAAHGQSVDLGVPVGWVLRQPGARGPAPDPHLAAEALAAAISEHDPDVVVDRSDEPVLDSRSRLRLAATALIAGVAYEGPDFTLRPPPRPRLADRPAIAVIGTGKRTGKTAVAGEITRTLQELGRTPVVVAMGRGGPSEPLVVPAGAAPDLETLLAIAEAGGHAASDCYEDALTTGAATVGARRCGGGLAGAVGAGNVAEAVQLATKEDGDVLILEGSGAAVPPVHADATVLVVPGDAEPELVAGYLGPYRLLLADLVVVTMAEPPRASSAQVEAVQEAIRSISRRVPIVRTVFRPTPLGDVSGARVLFATTAPSAVSASLASSLESQHGCEVVGVSTNLADREALRHDLRSAPAHDVLLVELKAAAVDVAARTATSAGARVVFCDNRPVVVDEHDAGGQLAGAVARLCDLADQRFTPHGSR